MAKACIRAMLWVLTAGVMIMIFCFSAQDGVASTGTSDRLVIPLVEAVASRHPDMTDAARVSLYEFLQTVVRKGAHFSEFALLGMVVRLLGESYGWPHRNFVTWGVGTLYAVTDELHQLASALRFARVTDVIIDSAGVLTGIALAVVLRRIIRRTQARSQDENGGKRS